MRQLQFPKFQLLFAFLLSMAGMQAGPLQNSAGNGEFRVHGNCDKCKTGIEKAAKLKGVSKAEWDHQSKVLKLSYNSDKTSVDAILKSVAYAGYDNEKYLAPDNAYAKLEECCKYERVKRKKSGVELKHEDKEMDHSAHQKKNELENSYQLYFEVKDALVNEDANTAASKSKRLFEAIEDIKMGALDKEEHEVFMKYFGDLKLDSRHISESKDIDHQREHFSSLSDKMFELMKVIKPAYPVYLENCPMFKDGKSANWISKDSAIRNPYYGSKMLTCGKVKETIK